MIFLVSPLASFSENNKHLRTTSFLFSLVTRADIEVNIDDGNNCAEPNRKVCLFVI